MTSSRSSSIDLIIRAGAFCVLMGWALMHFFWDTPYRSVLWNEALLSNVIPPLTGMTWTEYVTGPQTDSFIRGLIFSIGTFMVVSALTLIVPREHFRKVRPFFWPGAVCLSFLLLLLWREAYFRIGMLIEHAAQAGIPYLAYLRIQNKGEKTDIIFALKIMVALTFLGHGLYAIGFHAVPGNFIDMVIEILRFSEAGAKQFLFVVGVIDVILVVLLFTPRANTWAAGYCVFWGFLTSMARPVSFILLDIPSGESTAHWFTQALYRLPHIAAPLALLLLLLGSRRKEELM